MTTLIATRPKPLVPWLQRWAQTGTWNEARPNGTRATIAADEEAYLAVIVTSAGKCGEPTFVEWRAELKLAECSRALPLAWPLPDWLDDYRQLLARALADQKGAPQSGWWVGAIRAFLQLMLAGRDEAAAEFIRALTRLHPFADETRRLRRAQALFASIRPARSLADGLGFRIVTP